MNDPIDAIDDPFVHSPALAHMVELARAQRVPPSKLDAARLAAAVRRRRSARNRNIVLTAVALAAGIAALWFGLDRQRLELDADASHDAAARVADPAARDGEATLGERGSARGAAARDGGANDIAPSSSAPPPSASAPLPSATPGEPTPAAPLRPSQDLDDAPVGGVAAPTPSASELARQAERAMIEHRRKDAIELLTQLVRRYPTHASARTALLDLGRLLRDGGRTDEARCAYRLFVARWPGDSTRVDVERALAALGDGPECRGLRPRR